MTLLRAVKGMNDVLPEESARWQYIEQAYARTMNLHGFREVRTPYVEPTSLFVRAMGDTTDVVEKEMYSFQHHGDSLTLRPEGTAGAVRAYLEHAVSSREPVTRWWYAGPMFRAERPQRGRYRQFFQLGAEIFGDDGPGCDAEMITMLFELMRELEVPDVHLLINSLGGPQVRRRYREALVEHLTPRSDSLSTDSQRRLRTNPLRVLDSKDERDQAAVLGAPTIHEFLDPGDREHFAKLCTYLDTLGTPYTVDARLVRGIDYYTRTLFEIQGARDKLGAGSTLVGGGRYDGLVADLGGPAVSAIGFAAGLERLLIASDVAVSANSLDALTLHKHVINRWAEIMGARLAALEGAEAVFAMSISAGGYVRSVAHELGEDLGCGAHLSSLRRTRAGVFTLDEAHTLEELQPLAGNVEALETFCIHPRSLLPEMPCVTGDAMALGRLRNGAQANLPEFSRASMVKVFAGQRDLVGIAKRVAGTLFQPVVGMG